MNRCTKFLYPLLIGLLAVLAVAPHRSSIEDAAEDFYRALQMVRNGEPKNLEHLPETDKKGDEPLGPPRRALASPEAPTLKTPSAETNNDPFLDQARLRAIENPEAAMRWLQEQHSGSERLRGMLVVVALWASEDSESALLWLESHAEGLARHETLTSGIEIWAERTPTETASWIDGMANDGSKATASKTLAAKWAEASPLAAANWVNGLDAGPAKDAAASGLVNSWIKSDPQAALVWVINEAAPSCQSDLISQTMPIYSKQSPVEAEKFIRQIAELYEHESLVALHLEARTKTTPQETAEWFDSLRDSDPVFSPNHASEIARAWAASDSIAASKWLNALPPGTKRDHAITGFTDSIAAYEPEAAAEWANTISDPDLRISQLNRSIELWSKQSPQEALNWVTNADLATALRKQFHRDIGAD